MAHNKNPFNQPILEDETIESLSVKLLAATTELTKANAALKALQREREEMLSNISHDLRAPITAIRSTVDYLQSGEPKSLEEYQSALQLIDRRTRTLEDLIQDMYYLFCVEDTSKQLSFQEVDAYGFLEEYFYDALADSRYDTHDMQLNLSENAHCIISIDIQKMVRVLDNLFTNAAKYTPTDSRIELSAEAFDGVLRIQVADNGPGIPAEALQNIFKRTFTVSSARTPGSATGSGLGLSITKAILERHGGSIHCESVYGKGCRFVMELPCKVN